MQRDDIEEYLSESPSLQPDLPQLLERTYKRARIKAALELDVFPESCKWTVAGLLAETTI